MEEKKNEFFIWVKEHKRQLILAGVSISVILGIIIGIKNKDTLIALWASLKKDVKKAGKPVVVGGCAEPAATQEAVSENVILALPRKYTPPQEPFNVRRHIRNLAPGQVHSAKKEEEANALDIILQPSQTLVDSYLKYAA